MFQEDSSVLKTDDENEEFLSPESESDADTDDTNYSNEVKEPDSKPCDIKVEETEKDKQSETNPGDNIETPKEPEKQSVDNEKLANKNSKETIETDNTDSAPAIDSECNQNTNLSKEVEKEPSAEKAAEQPANIETEIPAGPALKEESADECKPSEEHKVDSIAKEPESNTDKGAMAQDDTTSIQYTKIEKTKEIDGKPNESDDKPKESDHGQKESDKQPESIETESKEDISVSEAIEEPVMHISGEGNGTDCESGNFLGEEIEEPVMFFWGEGDGYDNDTGNPDVIEQNSVEEDTSKAKSSDRSNGECLSDVNNPSKIGSSIKLRSSQISVTKRSFKNPSNDTVEPLKSDTKKPCVRDLEKSDSSSSVSNDKINSGSLINNKQNKRKTKCKVKKTSVPPRKIKLQEGKDDVNTPVATDQCKDNKATLIEKRKSSISSTDHEEEDHAESEKEISQKPETKIEETLPPKKLKLEKTPGSNDEEQSDPLQKNGGAQGSPKNSVLQRKTIKASRGKFKRKRNTLENNGKNEIKHEELDTKHDGEIPNKKNAKSLKRSLIDACQSDKNKSESQSESEEDEQATLGKRLKIKPKKIVTTSRYVLDHVILGNHGMNEYSFL